MALAPDGRASRTQVLTARGQSHWTLHAAIALAKELVVSLGDHGSGFYRQEGNALSFKTGRARSCPYGRGPDGDPHDSNNFSLKFWPDGSIVYFCYGHNCKLKYKEGPAVIGRWHGLDKFAFREEEDEQTTFARPRFDEGWYKTMVHEWEEEMSKKEADRDAAKLVQLSEPVVDYLNRYFIVVKSSKPEIIELAYDDKGRHIASFTRRAVSQHWALYPYRFMRAHWFASGQRRQVERLIFEVDEARQRPTDFNMFLGLKVERDYDVAAAVLDVAKIAHVLELILDVWCRGDQKTYEYVLNWFAYPLQKKKKTGVCLVIISPQGYGKGSIIHNLVGCGIYGEVMDGTEDGSYTQILDIEDIVGKFNAISCNRLFINANECSSFGGAYKQNNKMKSVITETTADAGEEGLGPRDGDGPHELRDVDECRQRSETRAERAAVRDS